MIITIENNDFKFHDYNPDSDGELIVEFNFKFNKFQCEVKGYTNQREVYNYNFNKRYETIYTFGRNKKHKKTSYDTYRGLDENQIKKSIMVVTEGCYNKNKKTRKMFLELQE